MTRAALVDLKTYLDTPAENTNIGIDTGTDSLPSGSDFASHDYGGLPGLADKAWVSFDFWTPPKPDPVSVTGISDHWHFDSDHANWSPVVVDADPMVRPDMVPGSHSPSLAPSQGEFATPTSTNEVTFLNALNPDNTLVTASTDSYWTYTGRTAHKWGNSTAGTGATITYQFDPASGFTAQEKATFLKAFAMWSAVANVTFVEDATSGAVLLHRGNDGNAFENDNTTAGSGSTLGTPTSATISIDTSVPGFDLSGSLVTYGGYGMSTVIHEVGHLLGLGHGGYYNGAVDETTQQYSAFDDRQWTIMSYIYWAQAGTAKYGSEYTVPGTDWGTTEDFINRQAPHTIMQLDVQAIQQLYGVATTTPFSGGQVYGFNTNISGPLKDFFDFTVNDHPVVTLFNKGTGNTLDVSGFSDDQTINLGGGQFSSVGGLTNNLAIAAGTIIETVKSGAGSDNITGNAYDNYIDGGGNGDTMAGLGGSDTYIVDSAGDNVIEAAGSGTRDWVGASVSYELAAGQEIELLSTTYTAGTAAINLTGNELVQRIIGNNGVNVINGMGGADQLEGKGGSDIYIVDNSHEIVLEAVGAGTQDWIQSEVSYTLRAGQEIEKLTTNNDGGTTAINFTGNEFAQTIKGNNGANTIDGKGAADIMEGLSGNDTYIVDKAGDFIIETSTGGTDWVAASVNYVLTATAHVEKLSTTWGGGTAAINLTGNNIAQTITGNNGVNIIDGKAGNDYIDGAGGADIMNGGAGNDTFIVDNAGDFIIETSTGGSDWVAASVNYVLTATAHVEKLTTTWGGGTAAIRLTGNNIAQTIIGNDGVNVLDGRFGNDRLIGDGGTDYFDFTFNRGGAGNIDIIQGYSVSDDTIRLENSVFTGLLGGAYLAASAFAIGTAAVDALDRIIYNAATGALYFDDDGSGAHAATQFATISSGLAMTAHEFYVI